MSGALGVVLSLLTIAGVFILRPDQMLGIGASATADLAKVALLLSLASLSSVLGLLSPAWSASRVAAIWGSVVAAMFVIALNINTINQAAFGSLPHAVATNRQQDTPVQTGTVRLRESVMPTQAETPQNSPLPSVQMLVMAVSTDIKAGANGHFFTTAQIDYTPVTVLIDTGASMVAMSYADADKAGLHPFSLDYTVPVSTANGVVKAALTKLKRVEIDNIVVYDVDAIVMPQGVLKGTLLGMSFLSRLSGFGIHDGVLTLEE